MNVQPLIDEFESRGQVRGGTLLLPAAEAIALIRAAERRTIGVLGVDCFVLTSDQTKPLMDEILDISANPSAWDDAVKFVEERESRSWWFEVVLAT